MGTRAILLAALVIGVLALAFLAARAGWRSLAGPPPGPAVAPRAAPLRGGPGPGRSFEARAAEVDALIERAFELGDFGDSAELVGACRLALAGGKRLRSAAVLEIAVAASEGAGLPGVDAAEAALAVEYLHAASLVVDDLPAFDGDLVRRGAPSVHAAAGGAVAQMAAAALVAAAFVGLCRQVDWLRARFPARAVDAVGTRLCAIVAESLGALGAASGQLLDARGGPAGPAEVAFRKTAPFFEAAFAAGWLSGCGAAGPPLEAARAAGRNFGFAFQVADDLGDLAADARRGAPNYAAAVGREGAELVVAASLGAAEGHLRELGLWGPFWGEGAFPAVWGMCAPGASALETEGPGAGAVPPGTEGPEAGGPEADGPEGGESEGGPPESGEPEGEGPAAGEPEDSGPEAGGPEADGSEGGESEGGPPESGEPEGEGPAAGEPEAGGPEGEGPEAGEAEDGEPEAGGSEAGGPEGGGPEAGEAESGGEEPGEGPEEG